MYTIADNVQQKSHQAELKLQLSRLDGNMVALGFGGI
jgi:hypothetical protein